MLVRGFEAESLAVIGGSALIKDRRPVSSKTLAIWPLAPRAKKDAKKLAQRISVARWSHAAIAVRFIIRLLLPAWPGSCLGEGKQNFGTGHDGDSFQYRREAVYAPSVLRFPPSGLP